jgi:hypothetical protein
MTANGLSERLRKTLRTYCFEMDEGLMEALDTDVASGALDWFPAEFAAAIRGGELTPRKWEEITKVFMDDDDNDLLDEYLRAVWSHAAPNKAYPLDPQP